MHMYKMHYNSVNKISTSNLLETLIIKRIKNTNIKQTHANFISNSPYLKFNLSIK